MSGRWRPGLTVEQYAALEEVVRVGALDLAVEVRAAFARKPREREGWVHWSCFTQPDKEVGYTVYALQPENTDWVRVRITEVLP